MDLDLTQYLGYCMGCNNHDSQLSDHWRKGKFLSSKIFYFFFYKNFCLIWSESFQLFILTIHIQELGPPINVILYLKQIYKIIYKIIKKRKKKKKAITTVWSVLTLKKLRSSSFLSNFRQSKTSFWTHGKTTFLKPTYVVTNNHRNSKRKWSIRSRNHKYVNLVQPKFAIQQQPQNLQNPTLADTHMERERERDRERERERRAYREWRGNVRNDLEWSCTDNATTLSDLYYLLRPGNPKVTAPCWFWKWQSNQVY